MLKQTGFSDPIQQTNGGQESDIEYTTSRQPAGNPKLAVFNRVASKTRQLIGLPNEHQVICKYTDRGFTV